MTQHILAKYSFNQIYDNLNDLIEKQYVFKRTNNQNDDVGDLELFRYTNKCIYDKYWNDFTLGANGLIVCPEYKRIAAYSLVNPINCHVFYDKYKDVIKNKKDISFNLDIDIEGSVGCIYYWKGEWHVATKSGFYTKQAIEGQKILANKWKLNDKKFGYHQYVEKHYTYLVKIVYPEVSVISQNNIRELFYITSYNNYSGLEITNPYHGFSQAGKLNTGQYNFKSLMNNAVNLPIYQKGFIAKFNSEADKSIDGLRVSINGNNFKRAKKIIKKIKSEYIIDCLKNNDNLSEIRKIIPEENKILFDRVANGVCAILRDWIEVYLRFCYEHRDKDIHELGILFKIDKMFIFAIYHKKYNIFEPDINNIDIKMRKQYINKRKKFIGYVLGNKTK